MQRQLYRELQEKLAIAIKENNEEEIRIISNFLKIGNDQKEYFKKGLTGYPSIDEVWYKYYPKDSKKIALSFPKNKTVWDEMEEKLKEYYDYPAIEYFKKQTTRPDFIDNVYKWARVLKSLGVEKDEVVPIYGPFTPDICAISFALNLIGASAYYLKLAISPTALEEETINSNKAIVFDDMWPIVRNEFSKDKYQNILVYSASQNMPSPKKEIVSFLSHMKAKKAKTNIPSEKKYIWLDKAIDLANYYTCPDNELKVPFEPNRNAFITSSSGTTGGTVKGVVATNESVLAQIYQSNAVDVQYYPGDRILNHFPPTASTSLNSLFIIPLYHGSTVCVDPRVSPNDFYNQLVHLKPTLCVNTGSAWELFFARIEREMAQGKKFDFSFAKGWVIGGEGTDVKKFLHWQKIMEKCNSPYSLSSAYGQSELFSAITSEQVNARGGLDKQIMSVGIPYSGITLGVYDEDGNELSYNQRGEIIISGNTIMKEYYNKPQLTNSVKIDGEIHSGDIGEIDENGFVYVWGRKKDKIELENGKHTYLFDIANLIKSFDFIYDAIIFQKKNYLVAHIVWADDYSVSDKKRYLADLEGLLTSNNVIIDAYAEHEPSLPYSKTTLKKDRTLMGNQNDNYIKLIGTQLWQTSFKELEDGTYQIQLRNVLDNNCRIKKK